MSGVVFPFRKPTSKFQPWPATPVSSLVSQLPHGVTPPAQLRTVPARLDQDVSHLPRLVSNTRFVVPPLPVGMPAGA